MIYTTIITPFTISFFDDDPEWVVAMDYFLYIVYALDIILTFISAYTDNEENIIKSKKVKIEKLIILLENSPKLSQRLVLT